MKTKKQSVAAMTIDDSIEEKSNEGHTTQNQVTTMTEAFNKACILRTK